MIDGHLHHAAVADFLGLVQEKSGFPTTREILATG